ncbi:MAG: hypothetical protein M1827_007383 [Pycnora praestabilis]|nr:MAG: hypothetical protein M1827_007383 [Pycnora praestabilis]
MNAKWRVHEGGDVKLILVQKENTEERLRTRIRNLKRDKRALVQLNGYLGKVIRPCATAGLAAAGWKTFQIQINKDDPRWPRMAFPDIDWSTLHQKRMTRNRKVRRMEMNTVETLATNRSRRGRWAYDRSYKGM